MLFEQEATAMEKVHTMSTQIEHAPSQISNAAGTAPTIQAGALHGSRVLFVDNLRILLISMVLVVHLDGTYGAIGSWYYHDPANNLLTGILLSIPNAIGMGLFFLIAGYFTPGPYDRKGPRSFLRDRLVRLGIPVLIYGLLLDPLVVYIASGLHGSYWSFYANYLSQVRGVTGPAWFHRAALTLQSGLCCLARANQTSNAGDRQNWKTAQLSSDLWLHLRARSGVSLGDTRGRSTRNRTGWLCHSRWFQLACV